MLVFKTLCTLFSLGDKEQTVREGWTWGKVWGFTKTYGGAVAIGAGTLVAATGSLGAAGFTATGIATKSLAAKAMAI